MDFRSDPIYRLTIAATAAVIGLVLAAWYLIWATQTCPAGTQRDCHFRGGCHCVPVDTEPSPAAKP